MAEVPIPKEEIQEVVVEVPENHRWSNIEINRSPAELALRGTHIGKIHFLIKKKKKKKKTENEWHLI